jgi:transcriptional regulator with XRE-family HTH domain
MNRNSGSFYTICETVSTENFTKNEGPTGASSARFPALLENLNKFWELCGQNDSEAARRLGVKAQQFSVWRKGQTTPSNPARKHIAAVLRVSEDALLYGKISHPHINPMGGDPDEDYDKPIGKSARNRARLIHDVKELVREADDEVIDALLRNVKIFRRAVEKEKKQ